MEPEAEVGGGLPMETVQEGAVRLWLWKAMGAGAGGDWGPPGWEAVARIGRSHHRARGGIQDVRIVKIASTRSLKPPGYRVGLFWSQ